MKNENPNVLSQEISFRNREATLDRLVAEVRTLRELVRQEEMKLADENDVRSPKSHPCRVEMWSHVGAASAASPVDK